MSASQLPAQTKMAEGRICLTAHQTKLFLLYCRVAGSRFIRDCAIPNFLVAVEFTPSSPFGPCGIKTEESCLVFRSLVFKKLL